LVIKIKNRVFYGENSSVAQYKKVRRVRQKEIEYNQKDFPDPWVGWS